MGLIVLTINQLPYASEYGSKLTLKVPLIRCAILISFPLLLNPMFWKQRTADLDDRLLLVFFAILQAAHNVLPLGCCGVLGDVPLLQHSFVLRFAAYVSKLSIVISKTLTYVLLKPCESIVVFTSESGLSSST
jgi:hypothetical protein